MKKARRDLIQQLSTRQADSETNTQPKEEITQEMHNAYERLGSARERLLDAVNAFCDGLISEGQLRAVREMHHEQEERVRRMGGDTKSLPRGLAAALENSEGEPEPTIEADQAEPHPVKTEVKEAAASEPEEDPFDDFQLLENAPEDLREMIDRLDLKLDELEGSLNSGGINETQYHAIRDHYLEQKKVALRLHQLNPGSDRWKVVLEEGKTTYLMQLNESACTCVALYTIENQELLYVEGTLPDMAGEAVSFLRTFGSGADEHTTGRIYATHTEDGKTLILIPGEHSAALVVFSEDPPQLASPRT